MPTGRQASLVTATLTMLLRDCPVRPVDVKGLPNGGVMTWPPVVPGLVDCRVTVIRDLMMAGGGPVRDPDSTRSCAIP